MISPLLLYYLVPREMWSFILALFGTYWVFRRRVVGIMIICSGGRVGRRRC